jgi:16S rRNA (cytosine967-C5)-methyltransferase
VPTPARALAFAVLRTTFEEGAFAERAFRELAEGAGLEGRERAQAQRLAYGAVQRRGTSDAAIERLAERSTRLLDPPVLAALRLGLYELLFADATPDHAAVSQAVDLVKEAGAGHAAGFANAILRRAGREREALAGELLGDDSTPEKAAIAHSAPLWLARMWWEELGAGGARSLLAAINEPAEVAFRATADRDALIEERRSRGVEARVPEAPWPLAPPESIVVEGRVGEIAGELVAAGRLTPQSRGSAAAVEVLDPRPGDHVLDLCAGPGTKTGQIASRMGNHGETISVELDPARAGEVAGPARRLRLRAVTVREADAAGREMADAYDRVLVDAPCSDLGTLASRPDARWRKGPETIERVADLQSRILERAARALQPGGTLVYSTCTISRRENEDQVARLLERAAKGPRLVVEDLGERAPELASAHDRRLLQVRPDRDRTTGFFIARLKRDD